MAAGVKSASASRAITARSGILLFINYPLSLVYLRQRSLHLLISIMLIWAHWTPIRRKLEFPHQPGRHAALVVPGLSIYRGLRTPGARQGRPAAVPDARATGNHYNAR